MNDIENKSEKHKCKENFLELQNIPCLGVVEI